MIAKIPPPFILLCGALLIPFFKGRKKPFYMLMLAAASLAQLLSFYWGGGQYGQVVSTGAFGNVVLFGQFSVFQHTLTMMRIDGLSIAFGLIFHIALIIDIIFSWHVKDDVQHVSGMMYAGAAIGAVFCGDLITLFIYWELTAITSVFLIWSSRTSKSFKAGMRYLIIQVASGVILLAGVIVYFRETGSIEFTHMGLESTGSVLIFIAFGMKCAFPFMHNWLQDAYPEATITGTVWLSAFTTKLAIYVLARGYAGVDILIWIGAAMTVFPIFFAEIENDLRRVLSYSLNNQLGFMITGIGLADLTTTTGQLALNGTVSHAFCHILYKALLFMSVGAVMYRTGTAKAKELGGLYKSMPWTTFFCIIGAASISAFPLFSGFVSKSMVLTAASNNHMTIIWLMLLFASAGVLHHSGIKIPFSAFFAHDKGHRVKEAPFHMLLAMGITAFLCVFIGVFYQPLYHILPFPKVAMNTAIFAPYTTGHVVTQVQLLMWALLAFVVLWRTGLYPAKTNTINLDFDWTYRRGLPILVNDIQTRGRTLWHGFLGVVQGILGGFLQQIRMHYGPQGVFGRTAQTGAIAFWAALFLGLYVLFYYLQHP